MSPNRLGDRARFRVSGSAGVRGGKIFNGFKDSRSKTGSSQGRNLVLTGLFVPSSLDSGQGGQYHASPLAPRRHARPFEGYPYLVLGAIVWKFIAKSWGGQRNGATSGKMVLVSGKIPSSCFSDSLDSGPQTRQLSTLNPQPSTLNPSP